MIAVPQFIFHFMITFFLPILTRYAMDYPFAKQDELIHTYLADDLERVLYAKLSDVKRNQINGKFSQIKSEFRLNFD